MFILKKLHLENFMIVDSADFEFEDNQITAISGSNGQGKSTIFYAVAFCLTGFKKGDTFKNYIKAGTEEANVKLEAIFNDKPISYDIAINSGVHRTVIYNDIVYTNSEYNNFLKEYNLEELASLMFMFQGVTSIIDVGARERADKLKKLFKFDFPEIVSELKEKQDNIKVNTAELSAVSTELQGIKYEPLPMNRLACDEYVDSCKEKLKNLENDINQISDIDLTELSVIESQLINCQKQISDSDIKISLDKRNLLAAQTKIKEISDYINNTDIQDLNNKKDICQNDINSHEIEFDKNSKEYSKLNDELNVYNYKLKELQSQYNISKTGVCHSCGQPIDDNHLLKLKEELDDISNKINNCNNNIKNLNFDIRDLKGKELKKDLELIIAEINNYESQVSNLESYKNKIKETEDIINDRENLIKELNDKKDKLIKDKESIESLIPLYNQKETLLNEKNSLEKIINTNEENRIANIERSNTNNRLLQEKQERDERIKELIEKINNMSNEFNKTKTEIDIFNVKFPNYITLQACNKLEEYINNIVQKVFPYCNVILKFENTGLGMFYTADSSESEYLPISMASGCQRQILAIAYFIALARMSGITCIFLDEIDASSSSENAKIIYEFIANLDCFNQIFFISHRSEAYLTVKDQNDDLVTYFVENGNYSKI